MTCYPSATTTCQSTFCAKIGKDATCDIGGDTARDFLVRAAE